MRRTRRTSLLCGALAAALWFAASPAPAEWEIWSGTSVSGVVGEGTTFKCSTSFRSDDAGESLYFSLVELGFDHSVNAHLTLGAYYAHVNQRRGDGWLVEYRPHVNATVRWSHGPLSFSDRNRLELRTVGDETSARYRNRLKLSIAGISAVPVRPYVAVEPFYDLEADELNKNRTCAGMGIALPGGLGADVYYMYESRKKDGSWSGVPVAGGTLAYSF